MSDEQRMKQQGLRSSLGLGPQRSPQSTFEPQSGMWCIQGTISKDTGKGTVSPQFPTFYLHPEVQGCVSVKSAVELATFMLNQFSDPTITPNVSATLVNVASVTEDGWTTEELIKMDPGLAGNPVHHAATHKAGSLL